MTKFVSEDLVWFTAGSGVTIIKPILGKRYPHVPAHRYSINPQCIARRIGAGITFANLFDVAVCRSRYEDGIE
jgi:hypothetical protein